MPLSSGTRVGPYEVVAQVEAGDRDALRPAARQQWMSRLALATALAAAPVPVAAAPDFTASEILVSSETPLETDIVTFTVVARNTGADDAGEVYFTAEWPLMGFLVDTAGFEAAEIDHESRKITQVFPLAAGGERRFDARVLAPRDSGGDALTLAIHAAHFATGTEHWDRKSVTIDTRVSPSGVSVGGFRVAPAGVVTLAVLAGGVLLWLILRALAGTGGRSPGVPGEPGGLFARVVGPGAAAAAVTIAVGFWTVFGVMAWRDYRSLTAWPETTCTVLGGRLSAQSTTRSGPGSTSGSVRRDDTNYVPVLGLKYLVNGREMYSSGYDTGSRLGIGGRGGRTEELANWTVGGTTRCWYNPADPSDVVVLNGFGGAYLFALLPLPVFLLGAARVRSLVLPRATPGSRAG